MHLNAWWELKHQIWSFGFQSYYPAQEEYKNIINKELQKLTKIDLIILEKEWINNNCESTKNLEEVTSFYSNVITQELVRRAEIAAYRTENW